jgi:hypothetical protein
MVTMERRVGRLVEIRVTGEPDATMFGRVIALANEVGPDAKVILCSDIREAQTLTTERADRLATIQRATRERVERAVTLVSDRPVQHLVAERVRDMGPGRGVAHVAKTPAEAIALLDPLLTPAERTRLRQFLDGK